MSDCSSTCYLYNMMIQWIVPYIINFITWSKGESHNPVGHQQAEGIFVLTQGVLESSVITGQSDVNLLNK